MNKTGDGLQSARQKRSVEDAVSDEMEASCCATEADTQGGDEVMGDDSAAKRPKTGNTSGMSHFVALLLSPPNE